MRLVICEYIVVVCSQFYFGLHVILSVSIQKRLKIVDSSWKK